ncbi:MAG: TIGR02757 family protein, partial [Cyclobacteriaceae bacterium]
LHHKANDLRRFEAFKHRTFNGTDALYFIEALRSIYRQHESLEEVFVVPPADDNIERGLIQFHHRFFSLENHPHRTRKHLPTPERKSTCKRINMYLRWMVRQDRNGVDFGVWKKISPAKLVCPCDVHVDRVARRLKIIRRKQTDWLTALELTENLRKLDPHDPVKYDFALFGLGIEGGWDH